MHEPRILLPALLSMAMSCQPEPPSSPHGDPSQPTVEEAGNESAPKTEAPTRIFGPQGNLLPSDDFVAGIRLPRGLTVFRETDTLHVYRILAPIDRVLAYFGPMMITGKVERQGKGAVYRRASVRGAEINPTKVDVSILEVGSGYTRVAITELPPPPAYPPAAEETRAKARRDWRTLD